MRALVRDRSLPTRRSTGPKIRPWPQSHTPCLAPPRGICGPRSRFEGGKWGRAPRQPSRRRIATGNDRGQAATGWPGRRRLDRRQRPCRTATRPPPVKPGAPAATAETAPRSLPATFDQATAAYPPPSTTASNLIVASGGAVSRPRPAIERSATICILAPAAPTAIAACELPKRVPFRPIRSASLRRWCHYGRCGVEGWGEIAPAGFRANFVLYHDRGGPPATWRPASPRGRDQAGR